MSMPVSNSLGVKLCMNSDYNNGATSYYTAAAAPYIRAQEPSYSSQPQYGGRFSIARPRSGKCFGIFSISNLESSNLNPRYLIQVGNTHLFSQTHV